MLMRVDYNVPIKNGVITDTTRIDTTLDTLRALLQVPEHKKPKCIVLICHLGRPGGKFKRENFSLEVTTHHVVACVGLGSLTDYLSLFSL